MSKQMMLVTGPHGFVGSRIVQAYRETYEVRTLDRAILRADFETQAAKEALTRAVVALHPDVIVHTAAISDIGTCERNPADSRQANLLMPCALALAAKAAGSRLLAFSTDQVYTGCQTPGAYTEDEPLPLPTNIYARHKLEMEKRMLDILPQSILLRATWMYDMPVYGEANRGNFLMNALRSAMTGEAMAVSWKQMRGITYVRQVAELIGPMAKAPGGVYNYGSENSLNMGDTARTMIAALGLAHRADELVRALDGEARHNLWMDCAKARAAGVCFDSTAEGIARCVRDYSL